MSNIIIAKNKYQQQIALYAHDRITQRILDKGIYDPSGIAVIETILSKLHKPIVFDIGANVGNHALIMTKYSEQIYLFEPQAELVTLLHETKTLNQIHNWHIFPAGLSNEDTILPLYVHLDGNNGASTFHPELHYHKHRIEHCQLYRGDDIITRFAIPTLDFIKIDVEGYEAKVALGLQHAIKQFKPIIMLEWNNHITKNEFTPLFSDLFKNYQIIAITKPSWLQKLNPRNNKPQYASQPFNPSKFYQHILLIPDEKSHLFPKK